MQVLGSRIGQQGVLGRGFTSVAAVLSPRNRYNSRGSSGLSGTIGVASQTLRQPLRGPLRCVTPPSAAPASLPQDGSCSTLSADVNQQGIPEWLARIRAITFYISTLLFATVGFCIMLIMYPLVLAFDKYRRRPEHFINNIWARLSTLFYFSIDFEGLENLPPPDQPAVYVANHLSFLDIYTLFHLNRDFKFISKTSNFLIPVIGWSMYLTGHVMINRVDRRSQLECLKECGQLLKKGASVLFFPEGTRSKDGKMYAFKKGAFSVAAKAKVPVVPITLLGTGDLMPNTREYLLFTGKVRAVVHPPIPPQDVDAMAEQAQRQIASALPATLVSDEVKVQMAKTPAEEPPAALAASAAV